MDQNRLAQIALHFIPGVGHMLAKQLISYSGSAEALLKTSKGKLLKTPGIGPHTAEAIVNQIPLKKAEEELEKCDKIGAKIILYSDKEFPKRLNHINDAPSLLYIKGSANLNTDKIVSIVGTRKATAYGKKITQQLVEELIPHNPLIVSGLAYGIDIHAHKSALKNNLNTIGVMASGIDTIYPSAHREVAIKMASQGALITENSIGSKPDAPKFPARNRIIAGMADVVIVIEAAIKGGALITAEIANTYNKDVFAVPGNLGNEFSSGCNNLIKINKAHLLNSVKDIEYIMNWEAGESKANQLSLNINDFDPEERLVIEELQQFDQPLHLDNLSWKTKVSASKLASILLNLEFKGYVISLPGKQYQLNK